MIPTVKSEVDAQAHVRSIVQRMLSGVEPNDEAAPSREGGIRHSLPHIQSTDMLRIKLCDGNPTVRVLAAVELGKVGTLDDIGLLSDLLYLPKAADEHPRERAALIHSMQRLAGITAEPFDLHGVVPVRAPNVRDAGKLPAPAREVPDKRPHDEPHDWKCSKCGADVPANFETCWACGSSIEGIEDPTFHRVDEV